MNWPPDRGLAVLLERLTNLQAHEGNRYQIAEEIGGSSLTAAEAEKAIPVLVHVLDEDPDTLVRGSAAVALGQIGPAAKAALPSLTRGPETGFVPGAVGGIYCVGEARQSVGPARIEAAKRPGPRREQGNATESIAEEIQKASSKETVIPSPVATPSDAATPPAHCARKLLARHEDHLKGPQGEILPGQNILLDYRISYDGGATLEVSKIDGSRTETCHVTATDQAGKPAAASTLAFDYQGAGEPVDWRGDSTTLTIPLMRYCRFEKPGTYRVRIAHELGWSPGGVSAATRALCPTTIPAGRRRRSS